MVGNYAGLFTYRLPVPEDVQYEIIEKRIWSSMKSNICDALNWNVHGLNTDQEETLSGNYVPLFSKKHMDFRQKLFYNGWQFDERDNRPAWLHLSPEKAADSDIMSVLRDWEIQDNNAIIKNKPKQYVIAKGDVLIPNHSETGVDKKYRGKSFEVIKILVPIGLWYAGYAELMVAADEKDKDMPARLKVSPVGIGKIYTEHQSIEQIIRDVENHALNEPQYVDEAMSKIMRVLDIEKDVFPFPPDLTLPKIDISDKKVIFPTSPHSLYAHQISEYQLKQSREPITVRKVNDFFTAAKLLISMKKGESPKDALIGQMCLAYLSEPDNFREMQNHIYTIMASVVSGLKDITSQNSDRLEGLSAQAEFIDAFIVTHPQSHIPPNMDLLLGDNEALRILNTIGKRPHSGESEEAENTWFAKYKSGEERIKISFLEKDAYSSNNNRAQTDLVEEYRRLRNLLLN